MKEPGRIAFVYSAGNLDSVPCLRSLAELLAEHGYRVDIFWSPDKDYIVPTFAHEAISLLDLRTTPRGRRRGIWRVLPGRFYWPQHLRARHREVPYTCVIGVDPDGLLRAREFCDWIQIPLVYWSLELLLTHELTTEQERALKARERAASREAALVIATDQERAAVLAQENGLSSDRMVCIPNAPLGPADGRRSDYLRRKYSLAPDLKIILYAGSLKRWACTHQLMHSTRDWPDNWLLVCQSQHRAASAGPDYQAALEYLTKPGGVIFSTDPVPQREYGELVRSADVGIALYKACPGSTLSQDNIEHIGLSSGKLAFYLWAGLPVIVSELPALNRLVTDYRCGVTTSDPSVTRPAIERILADYESYSRNALDCFNREFDITPGFRKLLDEIERLPRRPLPKSHSLLVADHDASRGHDGLA